jgi:hypothetical protein
MEFSSGQSIEDKFEETKTTGSETKKEKKMDHNS